MIDHIDINNYANYTNYRPQKNQARLYTFPQQDTYVKTTRTRRDDGLEARRRERIRKQKALQRKQEVLMQKIMLGIATFGLGTSIIAGTAISNINKDNKIPVEIIETMPITIDDDIQISIEHEIEEANTEELAAEIINNNPDIKEAYENIMEALDRFSKELGTDGLDLIKRRVEALGNGKVEVIDVLKILWIESRGRVYEPNNPEKLLPSYTNEAFGPFQITPDTMDYLNSYYGYKGTANELDISDPYDNLDACILNIRFLKSKRAQDLSQNISLPTGENLMRAVVWSYHDGAWANKQTDNGKNYVALYDKLSVIDEHSEVVSMIIQS